MAKIARVDSKNRITLGSLADGISSFRIEKQGPNRYLLTGQVEIPADEAWVFQNPNVKKSIQTGLQQAKMGKTKSLGSFSEFADVDIT